MGSVLASKKNIIFGFLMFFCVLIIAAVTYLIVYFVFQPKMLNAPQNVSFQFEESVAILSWDNVENAEWYSIHLLNRTDGSEWHISIYPINYTINQLNKVEYDLTSDINFNSNYSIIIKAMSEDAKLKNSYYSEPYELEQVDRGLDVIPLI